MKKIKIIIGLLLLLSLSSWVRAQEEHLDNYLEMAAENNPELRARFNEYLAALEKVPQVGTLPDPQVAFAYFIQPVETRVGPQLFRISASQFFPWFGSLGAKEDAAIQAAKAKYEIFREARSKIFNEVKSVYYNLYFNHKSVRITLENIDLLRSIQNLVTAKVESGAVSMVDEYRIEMEINDLVNQLALARDMNWVLESDLRNLLNANEEVEVIVTDSLWRTDFPYTRQAAMDSILAKNHRLLELDFRQASLEYQKTAARYEGMPGFKLGLDYIVVGKGENDLSGKDAILFPNIGITIPIYRNKYNAMVREVVLLEEANQNRSVDTENRLATLLNRAWKDYLDADRRIRLNEEQLGLSMKALKLLESEYATANTDFEEILRMERRVLKYHLEFEKAKTDKQAAIAIMEYLMGE